LKRAFSGARRDAEHAAQNHAQRYARPSVAMREADERSTGIIVLNRSIELAQNRLVVVGGRLRVRLPLVGMLLTPVQVFCAPGQRCSSTWVDGVG
jgi:hypothetical protein